MGRRGLRAAAVAYALALCLLLAVLVVGGLALWPTAGEDDRAAAAARVEEQARRYADAVLAAGVALPTDGELAALANHRDVEVYRAERPARGALVLVVAANAAYDSGVFRAGRLVVCYRLTFRALGAASPGYELAALAACPTERQPLGAAPRR
ncbi:MAG TPA: hypothetical protein VES42_27370 [Pilimelia sp.]|nr:hypothetical protein [Pilimelia sp.]